MTYSHPSKSRMDIWNGTYRRSNMLMEWSRWYFLQSLHGYLHSSSSLYFIISYRERLFERDIPREPCQKSHAKRAMPKGPYEENHVVRVMSWKLYRLLWLVLERWQSKGISILYMMPMIDSKSYIFVNHTKTKESIIEGYSEAFTYIYPVIMQRQKSMALKDILKYS